MKSNKINSLNTLESLAEYRKKINEACDKREKYIKTCMKASEIGGWNFGQIKESFENLSERLFKNPQGKKILNRYIGIIKESKDLSTLHSVYESVRKADTAGDVNYFVESLVKNSGKLSKKTNSDIRKLGRLLSEAYLLVGDEIGNDFLPKDNNPINNALEYIMENKKTIKNGAEFAQAVKIIKENLEGKDKTQNIFENKFDVGYAEKIIDSFNKKYNELTDEEKEAVRKINESSNKEALFKEYKDKCLNKINEAKANTTDSDTERLSLLADKVSRKIFCEDTINTDICNLIEITNIF